MILQEKMEKIKTILKKVPKGLTISDLSNRIKINRNSLAKYLEILLVTGQVEMESFGTAKVYCLSQRVPVTALLQFATDLIAMVDEEHTFIQINDNLLEFFGLKKEDLLGKRIHECSLPPITNEPLIPLFCQAQEHGEITREIHGMREGEEVYLREKIIPSVFDNGNRGATLIIENTTKQRQSEYRLAKSEEKYRVLAENTLDGIVIMRFDGTVLYANRALVRMIELDDAEGAINKNVFDFIAPKSRERARKDLKNLEEGASRYLATYPATTLKGRECWFECLSTRITYQGEPVNISSIRDITDQLHKDRELIIR